MVYVSVCVCKRGRLGGCLCLSVFVLLPGKKRVSEYTFSIISFKILHVKGLFPLYTDCKVLLTGSSLFSHCTVAAWQAACQLEPSDLGRTRINSSSSANGRVVHTSPCQS